MLILTGTSGFSYDAWRGSFYPPQLPARQMLSWYASRLPTVEVNATFYRLPRPDTLAGWRSQVPSGFTFALKAPQRITHVKRLRESSELVGALHRAAAELGSTLGPILYQLPPSFRKDVPALQDFLAGLPPRSRPAFEFRHASWFSDDVYAALRAGSAALCVADTDEGTTPLVPTAPFGYLRLRRAEYQDRDLRDWAARILPQPWSEAVVYFKHEDEGRGPALAQAMAAVVGTPPVRAPQPGSAAT